MMEKNPLKILGQLQLYFYQRLETSNGLSIFQQFLKHYELQKYLCLDSLLLVNSKHFDIGFIPSTKSKVFIGVNSLRKKIKTIKKFSLIFIYAINHNYYKFRIMSKDHRTLIKKIHQSDYKFCISLSGGGTNLASSLLSVPGASNSILEVFVPYSRESIQIFF